MEWILPPAAVHQCAMICLNYTNAGNFRDRTLEEDMNRANISEQITVRSADAKSHTAGFDVRPEPYQILVPLSEIEGQVTHTEHTSNTPPGRVSGTVWWPR